MKNDINQPKDYLDALNQAKLIITQSQEQFLRTANRISMEVRLNLGKIVDENSIKHDWGKSVIEQFSRDLTLLFPGNTGFSVRNIAYMRQFYNEYKEHHDLLEIAKEVSWRTNIVILTKVKALEARHFYLKMAAESMCNRDVISAQISSKAYERGFLQDKKHNFDSTLPEVQAAKASNMLKSSYFFETTEALALMPPLLERQVEDEMVRRIKDVLMMLGKGFSFMGNQYPIAAGGNNYRIDLLFF